MPGTFAVIFEPDPPCCLCHFVTAQAPCPVRLGVCTPNLQKLCIQSPRGTRGDWETPCPPSPHPASAASWRGIPPPPWHSASAHTQLFIASGNTPTTRPPPPPFNRHRVPAHTHRAGAPCREGSPTPAHSRIPAGEEAVPPLTRRLRALWGPSPHTPGRGAHSTLSTSQPNRQPPKEPGLPASVSPAGRPYVPRGLHLGRKMPPVQAEQRNPAPGHAPPPKERTHADSTQNPHSRSGMNLNDGL